MTKEKRIPGFTRYSVDICGNVYSNVRAKRVKLKPFVTKKGYLHVSLWSDGEVRSRKDFKVHRLVADLFITYNAEKDQVNHIDGNKENNCVNNLEWCTDSENKKHAVENKLNATGFEASQSKFLPDQINEIYKMYDDGFSMRAIGREFNVHHKTISLILSGSSYKEYYESNRRE